MNGLPCTYGGEIPIELIGQIGTWQHAAVNDLGVINKHFSKRRAVKEYGKKYHSSCYRWKDNIRTVILEKLYPDYFTGFKNLHAPAAFRKETFSEVWRCEPELLDLTCMDRFRTSDNLNQWVMLWWQIASGQFFPRLVDNVVDSVTVSSVDRLCDIIVNQKHEMICLNDPEGVDDNSFLANSIRNAFEKILPNKSVYEL